MRRKDREVTDINEIMQIIKKCDVCSVAFFDNDYPYIVPLNFGATFENGKLALYFHGANAGKKMELLAKDNRVAFEMSCSHKLLLGQKDCDCVMEFESVCGNGTIEILSDLEKLAALTALMEQYSPNLNHKFDENSVKAVAVLKLTANEVTGKRMKKE